MYKIIDEYTILLRNQLIKIPIGYELIDQNDICQINDIYYNYSSRDWLEIDDYGLGRLASVCASAVCRPKIKNNVVIE